MLEFAPDALAFPYLHKDTIKNRFFYSRTVGGGEMERAECATTTHLTDMQEHCFAAKESDNNFRTESI